MEVEVCLRISRREQSFSGDGNYLLRNCDGIYIGICLLPKFMKLNT